jgi:hypothetical protein
VWGGGGLLGGFLGGCNLVSAGSGGLGGCLSRCLRLVSMVLSLLSLPPLPPLPLLLPLPFLAPLTLILSIVFLFVLRLRAFRFLLLLPYFFIRGFYFFLLNVRVEVSMEVRACESTCV